MHRQLEFSNAISFLPQKRFSHFFGRENPSEYTFPPFHPKSNISSNTSEKFCGSFCSNFWHFGPIIQNHVCNTLGVKCILVQKADPSPTSTMVSVGKTLDRCPIVIHSFLDVCVMAGYLFQSEQEDSLSDRYSRKEWNWNPRLQKHSLVTIAHIENNINTCK